MHKHTRAHTHAHTHTHTGAGCKKEGVRAEGLGLRVGGFRKWVHFYTHRDRKQAGRE